MVEIYSPPGKEKELARLLASELESLGFNVRRDAVGNVIAEHGGGNPKILLCGHMDTVPPMLPVKVEDGVLYGRGSVDAKGPLAAIVVAASRLVEEGYEGSLIVAGVVDEEGKSTGIKHLVSEGMDADYAVFGEPTNVTTVTVGYRGSFLLRIICETETGHSSAPWLFENAVEKTFEIWNLVKGLRMHQEDSESRFRSLSKNLRYLEGGNESNIVPPRCEGMIEIRIPPSITVDELTQEVFNLIEGYKAENPDVIVEAEVVDSTEPYVADRKSTLVRAFTRAIWGRMKERVMLVHKTGTGDMNTLGRAMSIPVVTYGPGDSHLDHTHNECISLQDYMDSINVIVDAIKRLHETY
jgi:LysW-gamma-L-lysine carboxypeptidase